MKAHNARVRTCMWEHGAHVTEQCVWGWCTCNCSLLQPPNSGEEKINTCEAYKKNWAVVACFFTPVVNSSAEKYCIHIELEKDCWKIKLHVRRAHRYR